MSSSPYLSPTSFDFSTSAPGVVEVAGDVGPEGRVPTEALAVKSLDDFRAVLQQLVEAVDLLLVTVAPVVDADADVPAALKSFVADAIRVVEEVGFIDGARLEDVVRPVLGCAEAVGFV